MDTTDTLIPMSHRLPAPSPEALEYAAALESLLFWNSRMSAENYPRSGYTQQQAASAQARYTVASNRLAGDARPPLVLR